MRRKVHVQFGKGELVSQAIASGFLLHATGSRVRIPSPAQLSPPFLERGACFLVCLVYPLATEARENRQERPERSEEVLLGCEGHAHYRSWKCSI